MSPPNSRSRRGPSAAPVLSGALVALLLGVIAVPAAADEGGPTIEVRGRTVPLDGRPLPDDLTAAERRQVFEAAGRALVEAARSQLTAGAGPDWMPVQGTVELWCTQSNPGFGGCSGHHDRPALDIGVPSGTPVHAAGPGFVTKAESGGSGRGTYVDLLHPDGSSSHYYHLSALEVAPGQVVDRGTLLGRSGSTGSTTAPHLHYEEHGPDGQNQPIGPMYGRVGEAIVSYPQGPFGDQWPAVPYGTILVNDGYLPVDGDLNGDGRPDTATGNLPASAGSLGVSAALAGPASAT